MTSVPGASLYRNAAILANARGTSPSIPSLLDTGLTVAGVLQAGRNLLSVRGIGLSAASRALTDDFLSRTSDINKMFSLGLGSDATIEGLGQQILALRASLPQSQLARDLRDNGDTLPDPLRGNKVDEEA